jgi:preflagellin peptidase FlaK
LLDTGNLQTLITDADTSGSVFANVPDLLRLLVLPFFAVIAWRDIKTRRVPNRVWYPLAVLAVVLLVWDTFTILTGDVSRFEHRRYFIQVGISIGFLIPLSYVFWLLGGFGGADAKAFMVLAILLPTFPEYNFGEFGIEGALATLPVVQTNVGVFALTVLSNTVLFGALYPVALAARNGLTGYVSPGMFVAKPIRWEEATEEYGTMLEFEDRRLTDDLSLSGLRSYFSWRSLDLDALRMYLQWRGCTLAELREDGETYRDPASLPEDPNPPGDGSMAGENSTDTPDDVAVTDGGSAPEDEPADGADDTEDEDTAVEYDDPWGAEAFLDDIEGSAYGTTPEVLRNGLDTLVSDDVVWISPGIPFLVPMFVGLLVAFTYGDLLFALLGLLGFV